MRSIASAAFVSAALLLAPAPARADGDEVHAARFTDSRRGLGLVGAGVGFAGRRESGGDVPITKADLVLSKLPSGAVVETAYLYWAVYGTPSDDTLAVDGTMFTGALIGTSAGTCWAPYPDAINRVYRADVTSKMKGNGTYELTDLPPTVSGLTDGQGASLVVIYTDPASTKRGTVYLHDGAITVKSTRFGVGTFAGVVGVGLTSATLRFGVGDGQALYTDGLLSIATKPVSAPDNVQHFAGRAGPYWDDVAYDVLAYVPKKTGSVRWDLEYGADCLVLAYSALVLERPDEGGPDAGGTDAGIDASASPDGGGSTDAGTTSDGGASDAAPTPSADGCGCRVQATASAAPPALVGLGLLAFVGRRRRRRVTRPRGR